MNGLSAHGGRIPLTVVGGFLGSGKTTLLNHFLTRNDGRRLAVMINDFGAVNVDAALVAARGVDTMTLTNGCVCCQIGGDLTEALIRVIESSPRPDAIVIEASGVSDPWRIAQVGLADPALALDGVVVLVDAATIRTQAAEPLLSDTLLRQLDAADLLVINHCDQADADTLSDVRTWLDGRLPATPRFETSFGRVPALLLGAASQPSARGESMPACPTGFERSDHVHRDDGPAHGSRFDTLTIRQPASWRAADLRALVRAMPAGVLRLKGVVRIETGWGVLQFAGRHGSLRPWPADAPEPEAEVAGTIVAVGLRGRLPVEELHVALAGAAQGPSESEDG
jgi:G3E family GTPase